MVETVEKVEAMERRGKNGDPRTPAQKAYDKVQEKRVSHWRPSLYLSCLQESNIKVVSHANSLGGNRAGHSFLYYTQKHNSVSNSSLASCTCS